MEGGGENNVIPGNEPSTPQYFGDYEVIRSIGKGKFAIVYRAHKVGDDQTVALKRISVDMMNDKAREKCLKEVRLLQSLDHPNIIRYMDSFICDNDLIIVYEWAAAGDLKRQLRKAQERGVGFEERVVWKYFSQICNAMKYMHEKRIMHRDLKPANIFLTLDGTIKVGDLGLSRELSEHTIQAHSKVGTPLYMSPEVLKGDGYDFKSDIWSLGCLLYELAALKSPFKAEGLNLMSLFEKISNGEYQPLPDTYSEELRELAYSMISTKPEDRPEIAYVCQISQAMRDKTTAEKQKLKRSMSNTAQDMMATVKEINEEEMKLNVDNKGKAYAAEEKKGREDDDERPRSRTPNRPTHSESQNTTPNNNIEKRNPFSRVPSNTALGESPSRKNPFGREAKREEEEEKGESSDDTHNKNVIVPVDKGEYTLNDYFKKKEKEGDLNGNSRKSKDDKEYETPVTYNPTTKPNSFGNKNSSSRSLLLGDDDAKPPYFTDYQSSEPQQGNNRSSYAPNSKSNKESDVAAAPPVYRRAKPPKGPQSSMNPPSSSAANKMNAVDNGSNSRPTTSNNASSRPTTVDEGGLRLPQNQDKSNPQIAEALENASQALALMEVVYSKLIVLGYPMEEPGTKNEYVSKQHSSRGKLLPLHFAINIQAFGSVAGHDGKYQFVSFKRLCHVILWLCEVKIAPSIPSIMKIVKNVDQEMGTNVTIAKQLLQLAQAAGEATPELTAITPSSLINGYGFNVCVLLGHFADCALKETKFTPELTIHEKTVDEEVGDNGDDEDDEIIDEDNLSIGEDNEKEEMGYVDLAASQLSTSVDRPHKPEYHNNKINPVLWKQETERVTPLLKKQEAMSFASLQSTWQHHLEVLVKYCDVHLQHLKEQPQSASGSSGTTKNVNIDPLEKPLGQHTKQTPAPAIYSQSPLTENILQLKSLLQSEIQKLVLTERYLNTQPSLDSLSRDFALSKHELSKYEERSQQTTQHVTSLTSSLAEVEEQLDELQRQLQSKMNGEDENGTKPVVRLKEAMQTLKQEINEMIINIGIHNHELLAKQKQKMMQSIQARNSKLKKSSAKRGFSKKGIADDVDDDYISA